MQDHIWAKAENCFLQSKGNPSQAFEVPPRPPNLPSDSHIKGKRLGSHEPRTTRGTRFHHHPTQRSPPPTRGTRSCARRHAKGAREGVEVCRELDQRSKFPSLLISLVVSLVLFVVQHLLSAREGDLADRFWRPRSPRGGGPFERRARRP